MHPTTFSARVIVLALALVAGCHRAPRGPEREYRFVHLETTGLTTAILVPGSDRPPGRAALLRAVTIEFSKDSDPDAVRSLAALAANVLQLNAPAEGESEGIVIVGVLDPEVRHTAGGPGRAQSEAYQEFRLSRWYLRAPFQRQVGERVPLDSEAPPIEQADRLRPEDFGNRIGGDLGRFVRGR